jgi:hypothetical protein
MYFERTRLRAAPPRDKLNTRENSRNFAESRKLPVINLNKITQIFICSFASWTHLGHSLNVPVSHNKSLDTL